MVIIPALMDVQRFDMGLVRERHHELDCFYAKICGTSMKLPSGPSGIMERTRDLLRRQWLSFHRPHFGLLVDVGQ